MMDGHILSEHPPVPVQEASTPGRNPLLIDHADPGSLPIIFPVEYLQVEEPHLENDEQNGEHSQRDHESTATLTTCPGREKPHRCADSRGWVMNPSIFSNSQKATGPKGAVIKA